MPTKESKPLLVKLQQLIEDHIEETGESVSSLAKRCEVARTMMSQLRSGKYPYSPQIEIVERIAKACGRTLTFERQAVSQSA